MIDLLASRFYYVAVFLLIGIGLYTVIDADNLIKKVIGLNIFQVGIFLFFITAAFVDGGSPPIVNGAGGGAVNPLPHVLILTAIVVGVSITALALALIVWIYDEYGTLDERAIRRMEP
jgi:multicomponent Na+:H+ antiporter subunit C